MLSNQHWRVMIRDMETSIRVGIHDTEKEPQRVLVNAEVECIYPCRPQSISECFNYDHIHRLVVEEWPRHAHVMLLETCVTSLLEYIFRSSDNVIHAKASVCKPDIFPDTKLVGVEAQWTRADFERLCKQAR